LSFYIETFIDGGPKMMSFTFLISFAEKTFASFPVKTMTSFMNNLQLLYKL